MYLLLALLPLFAYLCVFVYLYNRFQSNPVRRALIDSAVLFGVYLALCLEVLSIFKWITPAGLVLTWLIPVLLFTAWYWSRKRHSQLVILPRLQIPSSWWNRLVLLFIVIILVTTALVAWVSPPQTWDSLTYHLSRVAHWAQDRSIWQYATGIDRQASMPPGAEEHILDFYVLTQSDRLSNFPEWLAMLGSLLGVSLAAYYLGAKSSGQWLAALFAATIPMGIVEASSSINDYVATFWVVCVVVEVLAYYRHDQNRSLGYASLAAGLALLTKPVAVPFMLPFALWLAYLIVKRHGIWPLLKWAGIAVLCVAVINLGFLARNVITYGALSNPADFEMHYNQLHTPQGIIATTLKNIGMQVGIPGADSLNQAWNLLILKIVFKLGLDINDPRMTALGYFSVRPTTLQEDSTANPFHMYLIFALLVAMFFLVRKHGKSLLVYGLLAASTFLLFSIIYKWNAFGTRYDLAFFVILAPLAGVILGGFDKLKLGYLLSALLFIAALPWLFSIYSRPLIPKPGSTSAQASILETPRADLYFANAPSEKDVFKKLTGMVKAGSCNDIGLMLNGDDPEYLLWTLMDAPRSAARLEWIVSGPTDRYSSPDFQPCAIICHGCSEIQSPIRGLEIAYSTGDWWLYLPPVSP
jgi:hypothetical protein